MYWGNWESGRLSLTVTWSGPVLSSEATFSKTCAHAAPLCGFICRPRLNRTSSAVMTRPSWKRTPSRRSYTQVRGSGWEAFLARPGASFRSGVHRIRLSHTLERIMFCG